VSEAGSPYLFRVGVVHFDNLNINTTRGRELNKENLFEFILSLSQYLQNTGNVVNSEKQLICFFPEVISTDSRIEIR